MKVTFKRDITLASYRKLLYATKLGKIYARFEGRASFSVETTDPSQVELTLDKEAQLRINDLIFGASGAFTLSKDKLAFSLGIDQVSIEFEPLSLNPVSLQLPSVHLPAAGKKFELKKELPKLGLEGTATLDLEFVIDFIPDYRRLIKAVNAKNAKALARAAKSSLYKLGGKTKTVAKVVVRAGRAAVYAPLKWMGNSIGRFLAINAIKLGSQTKALQKLAGRVGKILGVAGIFLDTWLTVKAALPGALGTMHKRVLKVVNAEFAQGYTLFLAAMTDANLKPAATFFDADTTVTRSKSAPPDLLGVIEKLAKSGNAHAPSKKASTWRDAVLKSGLKTKKEKLVYAEASWEDLYREAYNLYWLFMDIAQNSSNSTKVAAAFKVLGVANKMVKVAGIVAAYQDIVAFVVASSMYEDVSTGKQPTDVWAEWKAVAEFHRSVFDTDALKRQSHYLSLVDTTNLRVAIPPFTDFN